MSQENVEIVRRLFDAASRGDATTVFSMYDQEVEFDSTRSPLPRLVGGGSVYVGHEGLRRFFRERSEHMEEIKDNCDELIEAGEDVVSVVTTRARGRASGVEVAGPSYAAIWTLRDGKIVRVVWFPTREEAVEAAGVSE
jgi:ketosteroid isomerase-like protein